MNKYEDKYYMGLNLVFKCYFNLHWCMSQQSKSKELWQHAFVLFLHSSHALEGCNSTAAESICGSTLEVLLLNLARTSS